MPTQYFVVNGSRRRYQVPQILHEAGMLAGTFIDGCATVGWPRLLAAVPASFLPASLRRFVDRRPLLPANKVWSNATLGFQYAWKLRRAGTSTQLAQTFAWYNEQMDRWVEQQDWSGTGGLFVFDSAHSTLIAKARRFGLRYIHEQTLAAGEIVQKLIEAEAADFPGWEEPEALPPELFNASRQAYTQSWAAAHLILCASDFVVDSIRAAGGPVDKCVVLPYGVGKNYQVPPRPSHSGPLRVLTVGTVGLRKGSQYVLAAARRMGPRAEFRMVGTIAVSAQGVSELKSAIDLTGPVRQNEVLDHLAWADVFLLPSVGEGSAVAVYEAMAAGLPVITTPNAGSIIRHGIDGLIVPIRDVGAIVESLSELAANPSRRDELGEAARRRSAEYDSDRYARDLVEIIQRLDVSTGCP